MADKLETTEKPADYEISKIRPTTPQTANKEKQEDPAEVIKRWFEKHFVNAGLDTKTYNLAVAARDDLINSFTE